MVIVPRSLRIPPPERSARLPEIVLLSIVIEPKP
jgi:hypothetical protein